MTSRTPERSWIAAMPVLALWLATALVATPGLAATAAATPAANETADPSGEMRDMRTTATEVEFDPAFFRRTAGPAVDVARYKRGNPVPAGHHLVDLRVNGGPVPHTDILFSATSAGMSPAPCLDETTLDRIGVDLGKIAPAALARLRAAPGGCLLLTDLVADARATFNSGEQILEISVPQAALRHNPRGYVDPRFWDQGVTSARLGYNFNLYHTEGMAGHTQAYLGMDAGFNAGPWRFRHTGALTAGSGSGIRATSTRSYVERDITRLKSQLLVGDAFTSGELFDGIGYRGVSLATDVRMLPESQRGYAPVVRGVARTNANVVIRQNGNLIRQSTVAPGPFEIDDLYETGYGGDLVVTVKEADGQSQTSTVPFAATPRLLRAGTVRYSFTAGQIRSNASAALPFMVEATAQRGLSNFVTGYAGVLAVGRYRSGQAGVALNTRMGAIGTDLTVADAGLPGIDSKGTSFRVSYSRAMPSTGTNFTVAAYRYSSKGFWTPEGALQARSLARAGDPRDIDRRRNTFQVNMTQALKPGWGSLYLTASTQQYWNRSGSDTSYQAGYSGQFKTIGYTLSASRQADTSTRRPDNRFMLSLNLPLGRGGHAPTVSSTVAASSHQPLQAQATVMGVAGREDDLSWSATVARQGDGTSLNGSAQYRTPIANLSVGAGAGKGYRQGSLSASGMVLVHPGGVTFGPPAGEAIAILHARGAAGARVASAPGVRVDGRGYAIVPYLTPYARNTVEIDPKGLGLDVELTETSQTVAPRAGAVVRLNYGSVVGRAAIITVRMAGGGAIPFGASVLSPSGEAMGQAGQGGRIFVRGVADSGFLLVRWGEAPNEQCRLDYRLPPRTAGAATAYDHADVTCVAVLSNSLRQPFEPTLKRGGASKPAPGRGE
jgi:outer membrane usher protein